MALGFQNCCDVEEYFYVTGIPGSVSEFEIYYIETVEGEILCGTYVELPTLDYQPITYDLVGMTAQTSCSNCILLNPCPTGITIDFGTQSTGIFTPVNECNVKTIFPFTAECRTVVPVIGQGNTNGSVSLFVTGGTPPYNFYSAGTETQIGIGILPVNNEYLLYENVPAGDYSILVHDFWGDNVQVVTCNIPIVPDPLYVECQPNSPEFGLPSSGSLDLLITGGTEPYSIYLSGNPVSLPIFNLTAGTYTLVVEDNGVEDYFQTQTINCTLLDPEDLVYPSNLCMTFQYCGVNFYLDFVSASTLNSRPVYSATTPSEISVTGITIYYDEYWLSSIETHNAPLPIPTDCEQSNTVSFTIGNTLSDQPMGSNWIGGGTFANTSPIVVTSGQCSQITPTVITNAQGGCGLTDDIGSVVLFANPSSGQPYTYYVDGFEYNTNIVSNLGSGGHTAQVLDVNGNLSNVVSFTINNSPLSQTYWDYCSYVNTFTNTINGGIKKDNFKARFLNTTSNCSIRAKLRIIYEYAEWSPNNQNTSQSITPYTGTQLLVYLNNVIQPTVTFQLISSQNTIFGIPSCSPTNTFQPFTKTIQVYETTNFINFITLNSLVEVRGVGFGWAWNTTAPLLSYPQCYPSVSGTSTVQIFNATLTQSSNCQCILPPQDVTIGVSQINVNRRNTTLVGNVILNTPANIPANMNCTV
jgi:hypothetical protein